MKKNILSIIAITSLLPLTSSPICLRYINGPSELEHISVYSDATKAGSYLPTGGPFAGELPLNGPAKHFPDILGDHAYITIKAAELTRNKYTNTKTAYSSGKILVRGEKLNNKASYEITIDEHGSVNFREVNNMCGQD